MSVSRMAAAAWLEAGWWLGHVGRGLRGHPGHVAVGVGVVWLLHDEVAALWIVLLLSLLVSLRAWVLISPVSCHAVLIGPARRLWWRSWMRRHWGELTESCGLGIVPTGRRQRVEPGELAVPRLRRIRTDGPRVRLEIRPLVGQTLETFSDASERLRMAAGASHVRTHLEGVNRVVMTFTVGDALAEPFSARHPEASTTDLASVVMGRCDDGSPWRLPVGPHTLVAGMSGAGKGSVFWSFAMGLAGSVRRGSVQLHGVDLKGGMEVLMGAGLFSTLATDAAEAVGLLEDLVLRMQSRTRTYAGRVRSHTPSLDEPLHVVMIDELAALTAYCPDRDLQRRAELAINLLCSQGRAPGFVVFACLQDPRKEVIPSRGLFTQMVGLRLKDVAETAMVLGDAAVSSGALCHRITRTMPGTGYVVPEDGGFPLRVRAGYVSDEQLRRVAVEFATPVANPRPVLAALESGSGRRRPRSASGTDVA